MDKYDVLLDLVNTLGPVSAKLSDLTNRELADILLDNVYNNMDISSPQSAFVAEVAERLILFPEFVRGGLEGELTGDNRQTMQDTIDWTQHVRAVLYSE